MTVENASGETESGGNADREIARPTLFFESVTFSGGTTLDFEEDEIVVFVGPNNAGKSAALKEMEAYVARSNPQTVITAAKLRRTGTRKDLLAYLEKNTQRTGRSGEYHYAGFGFNIAHSHLGFFDNDSDRHPLASFFSTRLATENRIIASNPAGAVALYQDPATHPIHLLLMDDKLAERISGHFKHAFGQDLFPFRAGGGAFPLYVGRKPQKADGEDELSKSFVERIKVQAVRLESQGDGMRSFATVLLYVLVADNHSVS